MTAAERTGSPMRLGARWASVNCPLRKPPETCETLLNEMGVEGGGIARAAQCCHGHGASDSEGIVPISRAGYTSSERLPSTDSMGNM